MVLQQKVVTKIDSFGGRKEFIADLKKLSKISNESGQSLINRCIVCFSSLYYSEVDVVDHTIKNKTINNATVSFLKNHFKNNPTAEKLIDIIEFKNDFVKDLRVLR